MYNEIPVPGEGGSRGAEIPIRPAGAAGTIL